MRIVEPSVELLAPTSFEGFLTSIERAGRTCYKSEDKITIDSAPKFVKMLIDSNHEAVLEHAPSISMRFVCDRAIMAEITRHRLFSYCVESTRYVNYNNKEMRFVRPYWATGIYYDQYVGLVHKTDEEGIWLDAMGVAERYYKTLISHGQTPQQARAVLPNSLKTEVVVTGNVREWRHFFKLRTAKVSHPDMRIVANMALDILQAHVDVIFDNVRED